MSKERLNKNSTKNKFYKTNPSGGISLIVLVITIIVVIILAAAVIVSLQNNNPMIEANKARINSDVANMQAIFTNTVGKIMAENQDTIQVDPKQLNTVTSGVKKVAGEATYKIIGEDGNPVVEGIIKFSAGTNQGTTYYTGKELPIYGSETKWYIDEQGLISVEVGGEFYGEGEQTETDPPVIPPPPPEEPEEPEEPVYEDATVGEKVVGSVKQYTDKNGEKAIIPIDFAVVPGKDEVSKGLVISDIANDTGDTGNQFVWVPVNNMENFKREQGYNNGSLQTNYPFENFNEPLNYNGTVAGTSETEEYDNMIASVREYKGFYIGRYEISNDGSNNVQSKKGKNPWVSIEWSNSMTDLSGGIVEKARAMYPEATATKGKVVSTLVYGICLDETIRFVKKNYAGVERDSSEYGNYATVNASGSTVASTIKSTGSDPKYALNNIYDMAGNVWEWTMEVHTATKRVYRGGSYGLSGLEYPVSSRNFADTTNTSSYLGGRVQLYIK